MGCCEWPGAFGNRVPLMEPPGNPQADVHTKPAPWPGQPLHLRANGQQDTPQSTRSASKSPCRHLLRWQVRSTH